MAVRVKDEGESECQAVTAWIGVATSLHAQAGRLPFGNHHETAWPTDSRSKADDSVFQHWCGFSRNGYLAQHQVVSGYSKRASAPSPNREGNPRRTMGQGRCIAANPHPLLLSKSTCCETSDRESRKEHPWNRQSNLADTRAEDEGHSTVAAAWLPSQAATTSLHSQKQWKAETSRHSDDEGSSHAGSLPASS